MTKDEALRGTVGVFMKENKDKILEAFEVLQAACFTVANAKGFWPDNLSDRNAGEAISLCHSELSEALESLRHGELESKKIPGYTNTEEEFADLLIRVFDWAGGRQLQLGAAIIEKIMYNVGRPHKHGKEF